MAWTAPKTWVALELVEAADMNTHIRDNLEYLKGGTGTIAFDGAATQTLSFGSYQGTVRTFAEVSIATGAAATTIANFGTAYYSGLAHIDYEVSGDSADRGSALVHVKFDFYAAAIAVVVAATTYGSGKAAPSFSVTGTGTNAKLLQATPNAPGVTGLYHVTFFGHGV